MRSFDSDDCEAFFRTTMYEQGLAIIDMEADGNCLFRSVSDQIFGDAERHLQVRAACAKHLKMHEGRFGLFHPGNFRKYLEDIKRPSVWGGELEIRALEEVFDRPVEIYSSGTGDLTRPMVDLDAAALNVGLTPIRLSYHGGVHYNSLREQSTTYPLKSRRSKGILNMRVAQHTRSPRSSAAAAAGMTFLADWIQGLRRRLRAMIGFGMWRLLALVVRLFGVWR